MQVYKWPGPGACKKRNMDGAPSSGLVDLLWSMVLFLNILMMYKESTVDSTRYSRPDYRDQMGFSNNQGSRAQRAD